MREQTPASFSNLQCYRFIWNTHIHVHHLCHIQHPFTYTRHRHILDCWVQVSCHCFADEYKRNPEKLSDLSLVTHLTEDSVLTEHSVQFSRSVVSNSLRPHGTLFSHKKNEIMPLATTWMDPEMIILSEVSQAEKEKYHKVSFTCGF